MGSTAALLIELCARAGADCQISLAASRKLPARAAFSVPALSLALFLDSFCLPADLVWTWDGNEIQLRAEAELPDGLTESYRRSAAVRLLRHTIALASGDRPDSQSVLELAAVLSRDQVSGEVVKLLDSVVQSRAAPRYRSLAAFNLGKVHLLLGDEQAAQWSFQAAIDMAPPDPLLRGAASLYVSRLLLEQQNVRSATSGAMRALTLCEGSPLQHTATELLAACHLVAGQPQAANGVLMQSCTSERTTDEDDRVAFLGALARFEALPARSRRERDYAMLLEAVAHLDPADAFGQFWWLLAGRAYLHLGLHESAANIYLKVLRYGGTETIRRQMVAEIAKIAPGPLARSLQEFAALSELPHSISEIRAISSLQEAEQRLMMGDCLGTMERCGPLLALDGPPEVRMRALRLMGLSYYRCGRYTEAIACFTGTVDGLFATSAPREELSP